MRCIVAIIPPHRLLLVGVALHLGLAVASVAAQPVRSRVEVATLSANAMRAYRTWEAYLISKDGKLSAAAGKPSVYWSAAEQRQWPTYDLAGFYLRDDAVPEILAIDPVNTQGDRVFRITTAFRVNAPPPATWWTDMTVTVFVSREEGAWRLSNALPRNTKSWHRDTVGPITYVYAPGYPYNRLRALRAVAFTDSLATAFGVPPLAPLTYYLLRDVDEVYRVMGLESRIKFGATGGAAQPVNRQLFSGIPALGEEYRHELAHLILAPLLSPDTWYFASEGVPTWIGGTAGVDFPTAARALAATLAARPMLSLDSILSRSYPSPISYPAGAVLTAMIFERGGTPAVKEWLRAGPTLADLHRIVARLLQRPWPEIVREWRVRVMRYAEVSIEPSLRRAATPVAASAPLPLAPSTSAHQA